ncbi:MAG: exopolysaccharide Pel transporter PelG [Planctomycetes bacterium]|nr:exopolysaccharide Pel transporter PelG [Planctomycetota bacterium]
MAGIGFDLRRLCVEEQGIFGRFRAYATAGLVAAGPWLVTMASLWLVRLVGGWFELEGVDRFLALASLVFAASLVTTGGLQMAATRWLADTLYRGSYGALVPAFANLFVVVGVVQALTGGAGCLLLGLELELVLPVTLLYVAVSLSWLAFVWLSLIRQHDKILFTFAIGGAVFLAVLFVLGRAATLPALLWAYALSNCFVVAVLAVLVLRGTEAPDEGATAQLRGLLRHRLLWWVGTAYAVSLWADKFVFWWSDGVVNVDGVPSHPLYDTCFYLAYASVVPAMALNLIHIETDFYERYRGFYGAVEGHSTLADIRARGEELRRSLERAAGVLLRSQGAVTFVCFWFAPQLAELAGLPPFAAHTLRLALLGAFCHVLLLLTILVLLYFDRRRAALRTTALFLIANVFLALASVAAGPSTYGLGYAVAGLGALVWGVFELRATLDRIDYVTFAQQ